MKKRVRFEVLDVPREQEQTVPESRILRALESCFNDIAWKDVCSAGGLREFSFGGVCMAGKIIDKLHLRTREAKDLRNRIDQQAWGSTFQKTA